MRAVQLQGVGEADRLQVVEVDRPDPGPGQVLIEVEAAGVIFADVLLRRGRYVYHPSFPYVPGREVAGRVVAVGDGVDDPAVGDRVLAMMMGGGYAEYVAADVRHDPAKADGLDFGRVIYPVAEHVDAAQAVSHGNNLRVAHLILHGRAGIRAGQRILLSAASGGVGAHLTRLAVAAGLEVFALAGSPEKAEYCTANGAHHVIRYHETDYAESIKKLTDGDGVDVSINSVGADTLDKDASLLRCEGQLVVSGMAAGLGTIEPFKYDKALTYKEFRSYTHFGRPEDVGATEAVDRELQGPSHLDRIEKFALDDVVEAHRTLEAGHNFGKIILFP